MANIESKKKALELLAPAGDWDALLAGIAAGADAVYLGGKLFNARQSAANFDLPKLKTAVDLMHLHGKKIYVTVNTLILESELADALEYLTQLYNMGVDAVIVQDLGLINLARQYLPDLELHASTQMTVHNREGALYLKKLGIRRVVLARELTKAEVEGIALLSGVEIEIFIHGALCICYSGQCLMSSMIGGRSGNRGRCAQPCRMEYQLGMNHQIIPTKGSYLLSPKDIALIHEIPELDRIGVTSLKIEGRMKRPEYVYHVVRVYRQALDRFQQNPAQFKVDPQAIQELEQSFNRGFSNGYFGGNRNAEIMSFTRPNNRGVFLGRINKVNHAEESISMRLEADLEIGDEVEVWVSQGGRAAGSIRTLMNNSGEIDKAQAGMTISFKLDGKYFPGDRVFKVFSIQNDRETKTMLDPENPSLKIACSVQVHGKIGEAMQINYQDQWDYQGIAVTETVLQSARNRPLTRDSLWEQLSRLGTSPYYLKELETNLPENVMIPLSDLNHTRRKAIDDLTQAKLAKYQRSPVTLGKLSLFNPTSTSKKNLPIEKKPVQLSVWVADLKSVEAAVKAGTDLIYIGGDELTGFHWTTKMYGDALKIAHDNGVKLVLGLPRINREGQRDNWLSSLHTALKIKTDGIICSDLGTLQLLLNEPEVDLYLNYTLNFTNSYGLSLLSENSNIKQITISPELTLGQIKEIIQHCPEINLECLIHGPLELMVSEYCPLQSTLEKGTECKKYCRQGDYFFKDRLDLDFPIFCDQFCRMHLLNTKDLCLYEDLAKLTFPSAPVLRLELKTAPADIVGQLVEKYRLGLEKIVAGTGIEDAEAAINLFKSLTGRGITKGHYFRGVE